MYQTTRQEGQARGKMNTAMARPTTLGNPISLRPPSSDGGFAFGFGCGLAAPRTAGFGARARPLGW